MEKFNGTNFEFWKIKMEDFLIDWDIWVLVSGNEHGGMKDEEWIVKRKVRILIKICLADSMLLIIFEESTVESIWKKLGDLYQSKFLVNKLFQWKKLFSMRMSDGEYLAKHLDAFNTIVI